MEKCKLKLNFACISNTPDKLKCANNIRTLLFHYIYLVNPDIRKQYDSVNRFFLLSFSLYDPNEECVNYPT